MFCVEIRKIFTCYPLLSRPMNFDMLPLFSKRFTSQENMGVFGYGKGVVYLTSPEPTEIGLQLARPAILLAGKDRGECFYFF